MKKNFILTLIFLISINSFVISQDAVDNWTIKYDTLLKRFVAAGDINKISLNIVDYTGIGKSNEFKQLKNEIEKLPAIDNYSKEKQLSFWINIYNFLTINKIIENPEVKSIKQLNSFFKSVWQQPAGIINGKTYTLDEIFQILRNKYNEPRIHFAVNNSTIGSPDLRNEAYTYDKIYLQLNDQINMFIKNRKKGLFLDYYNKTLYLSKIFSWYAKDFNNGNVKDWLKVKGIIDLYASEKFSINYLGYDWGLNSYNK